MYPHEVLSTPNTFCRLPAEKSMRHKIWRKAANIMTFCFTPHSPVSGILSGILSNKKQQLKINSTYLSCTSTACSTLPTMYCNYGIQLNCIWWVTAKKHFNQYPCCSHKVFSHTHIQICTLSISLKNINIFFFWFECFNAAYHSAFRILKDKNPYTNWQNKKSILNSMKLLLLAISSNLILKDLFVK